MDIKMNYVNFDQIADIYDITRAVPIKITSLFVQNINDILKENYKQPPYRILSIGIGSGRVEKELAAYNLHLFGIDISELMLRKLRSKPDTSTISLVQGDALRIPFRGKFHLAVAIHVIHLIDSQNKFLNELIRTSEIIVIGDIYTNAYQSKIYSLFTNILTELGVLKTHKIELKENFKEEMLEKGFEYEEYSSSIPTMQAHSSIYTSIKNKYFSSLWNIPDQIYHAALSNLDERILDENIQLEEVYETTSTLNLQVFKSKSR